MFNYQLRNKFKKPLEKSYYCLFKLIGKWQQRRTSALTLFILKGYQTINFFPVNVVKKQRTINSKVINLIVLLYNLVGFFGEMFYF